METPIPQEGLREFLALRLQHARYEGALARAKIKVRVTWENKGLSPIDVCKPYRESSGGDRPLDPGQKLVVFEGPLEELCRKSVHEDTLCVMKAEPLQAAIWIDFIPEEPLPEDIPVELVTWFIAIGP